MERTSNQPSTESSAPSGGRPVPPGSQKDDRHGVGLVAALLLMLALGVGAYWMTQEYAETPGPRSRPGQKASSKQRGPRSDRPVASTALVDRASVMPASTTPATFPKIPDEGPEQADIYFDFDRVTLSEEAMAALKAQAERMKVRRGWSVSITGFTDKVGQPAYNMILGRKRAKAVGQYLVKTGVPEGWIRISSKGEADPQCQDKTKTCRQRNRRVLVEWIKGDRSASGLKPEAAVAERPSTTVAAPESSGAPPSKKDQSKKLVTTAEAAAE